MPTSSELELRRQLEEPLSGEYRSYPTSEDNVLVTMFDTPYYPPYIPDKLHCHNCLEIGICLAGCGTLYLHDKAWPFYAGSIIVAPRGVYHSQQNTGEPLTHWRYLVVNDECLTAGCRNTIEASSSRCCAPSGIPVCFWKAAPTTG